RLTSSPYTQRMVPSGSISSCMAAPVRGRLGADEATTRDVGDERLHLLPHLGHLGSHLLTQGVAVTQPLRCDSAHHLLGLLDQRVEFRVTTDVQVAEAPEELREVVDGRVPE